jgi:hypothetical protein
VPLKSDLDVQQTLTVSMSHFWELSLVLGDNSYAELASLGFIVFVDLVCASEIKNASDLLVAPRNKVSLLPYFCVNS